VRVLARGLHHPEGVAERPDGTLVCGSDAGRLYRVDPATGASRVVFEDRAALFLGVLADAAGGVLACDLAGRRVLRVHGSRVGPVPAPDGGWRHPSALCAAPGGGLLVSDSGRWSGADGRVVHVRPDGTVAVLRLGPLAFANGLCLDAAGLLCVVESAGPAVSRWDGTTQVARHVLPGRVPDGVAALVDGSLLVACYRPDSVVRVRPDGAVEVVAEDPTGLRLAGPTDVALLGADRRTAVLACFGGYHLAAVASPAPGLAPAYPSW
jgi:gluconolactonase